MPVSKRWIISPRWTDISTQKTAALWLFASGLVELASIGRRKI
jgi:hypothetical protein